MSSSTLLIGLGKGGSALLPYLLAKEQFDLVAVCDSNPDAIGVPIARQCGLPCYQDPIEAMAELHPGLVIDSTGDASLASTLYEVRPAGTSVVTGEASRLLWELLSAQEQQRRCEIRFNRLMEDMHSAIVVVQDEKIKFINRALHEMLGYDEEDILGHPYKTILDEDVADRDLQTHRDRMKGEPVSKEYDTKLLHDDGSIREARARVRKTDWEGRSASLIIMHDVTELRRLQREREQFFRYMVHELRAPLSPITMAIGLLRDEEVLEDKDRLENLVALLARSTDRLQSFVDDFLELAKVEEQELSLSQEPIDLHEIVEEIVDDQGVLAEDKGIDLQINEWDEFSISGDEFVVRTAVRNLVNNAIKYTDEGEIEVTVDKDARSFRIHVRDTGAGLDEEEREHIFQEFGRIRRMEGMKGTGLGLALVKKLVEAAGGDVSVESPGKDQGSTFTVQLPRVFGEADEEE